MSDAPTLTPRQGREGNRWVNYQPTLEEVGEWFDDAVKLHDGMYHADWVSGITLIESTETSDRVIGFQDDGRPVIWKDVTDIHYIPYAKVETRVAYFHEWCRVNKWEGSIVAVDQGGEGGLPQGFTVVRVSLPDQKVASLVCYSAQAVVRGQGGFVGPVGTKSVPFVDRFGNVDPNALMKAQTGAIGRALGLAGVLVIPGSGVASADDMQEAHGQGKLPGSPAAATEPTTGSDPLSGDEEMRRKAAELIDQLQSEFPEKLQEFQAWAREKEYRGLNTLGGLVLKGVVVKLERTLDAARRQAPEPGIDLSGEGDS